MFSKVAFLIQVLLVMVILISSMGEARHLVEKQNDVDNVKYCAKTSIKSNGGASFDCFIPDPPGLPWWVWPFISPSPSVTPSPTATPVPSPYESPAPSPFESSATSLTVPSPYESPAPSPFESSATPLTVPNPYESPAPSPFESSATYDSPTFSPLR